MWLYIIGGILAVLAVLSIERTQRLYKKYDTKLLDLRGLKSDFDKKIKDGYMPQSEAHQLVDEFIENFKEENIDAITYIQMVAGIKDGVLSVAGNEDVVMISPEYFEGLEKDRKLLDSLNTRSKTTKAKGMEA